MMGECMSCVYVCLFYVFRMTTERHKRLVTVILGGEVGMGRSCGQMWEKLILMYNLLNCLNLAMSVLPF